MLSRAALEALALHHLRGRGVPVESAASPDRPQTVHDVAPAAFGELVAVVHAAFDDFAPSGAEAWAIDVDTLTGASDRWLRRTYVELPEEADALVRWREAARQAIATYPATDRGMCHGEAYPATCRTDGAVLAVAELGWLGSGPRVYDLATYRWVVELHAPDDAASMFAELVGGYETVRPAPDLRALDGWVAARHLWSLRLAAGFAPTEQLVRRADLACTWAISAR